MPASVYFWLLSVPLAGISNIFAWAFKIEAMRYEVVTKVVPIFYLESVVGILSDYMIFNVTFSKLQLFGVAVVFTIFVAKIMHARLFFNNKI